MLGSACSHDLGRTTLIGVEGTAKSPAAELLGAIQRAHQLYFRDADRPQLFERMLEDVLGLTGCEYGFIGEVLFDDDDRPYLKSWALTNIAWDDATRQLYFDNQGEDQGLVFSNLDTLFGRVLTSGEPLISNDAPHDPRRGGLPPGHPPLLSFLGLPLWRNEVLIGMVGVANRPGGFDESDVEFLEPFLVVCAHMIDVIRTDRERAAAQEAEREARALAERQERLSYIGRLASGVAHDMNNLITMISLQCSLLESDDLSDSARQGVERILEACDNAAAMTARLQRLRSGSRGADGGSCAIVPALAGSMGFLRSVAGRGIDLRFHLDIDDSIVVELSEGDLLQVMLNLVSNAGDAQHGQGSIRVKVSAIVEAGRPSVEVLVNDDGPGVPADLAADVFTPFSSTKGEGRGLGLPTVHLLLERCGGTIELLEHDVGGATFRLVIPVAVGAS